MDNDNNPRELAEIVENAMREFREAMYLSEQFSVRIGRRTTQIIRFGMTGLSLLGLIMFYLLYILTSDFSRITSNMERISEHMLRMDGNFATVSEDMGHLRETIVLMNDNITVMPLISNDLHAMLEQMNHMNGSIAIMTTSVQLLNRQLDDMNINVGNMNGEVHQMVKPMKMFPFQ